MYRPNQNEESFLIQDIDDIQNIIRAQDTKIGFLFVVIFLPISNIDFITNGVELLKNITYIAFFLALLTWIISLISLIYSTFPRFSKKLYKFNNNVNEMKITHLNQDREYIYNICKKKIYGVRTCLCCIMIWGPLLIISALKIYL